MDEARGSFENARWRGGLLNELLPLPADVLDGRTKDGFTYPVVIYDHDEGNAVTDGFAYHGRIAALRGKFVFGDIQRGRLFAAGTYRWVALFQLIRTINLLPRPRSACCAYGHGAR